LTIRQGGGDRLRETVPLCFDDMSVALIAVLNAMRAMRQPPGSYSLTVCGKSNSVNASFFPA
jgi:hypothetical protein